MPEEPKAIRKAKRTAEQRSCGGVSESERWLGSVLGAAMGAYDGYKYAQKKNLKGWKKGAAILGGATLGAVNPFKVVKAVKTGYKAYKATKYGKKAASALKKAKTVKRVKAKPKITTVTKKSIKAKSKPKVIKQAKQTAKKQTKKVKASAKPAKPVHVRAHDLPKDSQKARETLNSFKKGEAKVTTYKGGTTLYRVGGGKGNYWSLQPPPATEYQWRVNYAIRQEFGNNASKLYTLTIPEGSSISVLECVMGPQGMGLYGGAHQAYLRVELVPKDWIKVTPMEWK